MKFLKPISKITKTIILGVGTIATIGFAAMIGVSSNQTYQVSKDKKIGIGSNNFNSVWENGQVVDNKQYANYDDFLIKIKAGNDEALKQLVQSNHSLWISGIVLTSLGIFTFGLGCYLLMFVEDKDIDGDILTKKAKELERLQEEFASAQQELINSQEEGIIVLEEIKEE